MTDVIQEMFYSNDFKDVTLVSEDRNEIKAHKNILSASSPVLKRLITDSNGNQPVVLEGVKYNELLCILQYIYLGETRLLKVNMNPFLTAAKKLQVKDLEKNVKKKIAELKESKLAQKEIIKPSPKSENEEVEILEVKDEKEIVEELVEPPIQTPDGDKEQASSNTDIEGINAGNTNNDEDTAKKACMSNDKKISQVVTPANATEEKGSQPPEEKDHDPYMLNTPKLSLESKSTHKEKRKKITKVPKRLSCDDCSFQTRKKDKLDTHIQVIHLGKRHKCDQCDYEAKYIHSLKLHISSKHEGLIFKCQLCDLNYSRNGHLKRHMQAVHEKCERKHKCPKCSYSAFEKSHLIRHIGRIHEGHVYPGKEHIQLRKFQCNQCEYRAVSQAHLKRHMLRKRGHFLRYHACPQCEFVTPVFLDLQNHCKNVHNIEVCTCKVCGKVLKDDEGLQAHIRENHGDDSKYSCKECNFKFVMIYAYKKHMWFKHKDESVKNIKCKFCPEKFIFKFSLSRHLKSKHSELTFSCDTCKYVSEEEQSLVKHKKLRHGMQLETKKKQIKSKQAEHTYSCSSCEYVSKKELSLEKHKRLKHARQLETKKKSKLSFQCKFCPEELLKLTFRKHMISKHVDHTFPCNLCDYVGVKKPFLDTHRKMKHTVQVETNKKYGMSFMQALDTSSTHLKEALTPSSIVLQESQQYTNNKIDSDVDDIWK